MADHPSLPGLQWRRLIGVAIGGGLGFCLARALPVVPSILLSALVLTAGTGLSRLPQDASRWWGLIGAACGCLIGSGSVLAAALERQEPAGPWPPRLLVVLALALAGAISGRLLSRRTTWPQGRQPRELLRAASGLTTGVFAGIVTLTYVHSGLDVARTLSSRLSTSLTILVLALVAPGWLSHLLWPRQPGGGDGA
jgi:hypothetical protein